MAKSPIASFCRNFTFAMKRVSETAANATLKDLVRTLNVDLPWDLVNELHRQTAGKLEEMSLITPGSASPIRQMN